MAISVDSPYAHRAWAKDLGIEYPLISDFGRELIRKYGVPERDVQLLKGTATRAAFVVDSQGIIRYLWYPPESKGLPPVEEILEAVRGLPRPGSGQG